MVAACFACFVCPFVIAATNLSGVSCSSTAGASSGVGWVAGSFRVIDNVCICRGCLDLSGSMPMCSGCRSRKAAPKRKLCETCRNKDRHPPPSTASVTHTHSLFLLTVPHCHSHSLTLQADDAKRSGPPSSSTSSSSSSVAQRSPRRRSPSPVPRRETKSPLRSVSTPPPPFFFFSFESSYPTTLLVMSS